MNTNQSIYFFLIFAATATAVGGIFPLVALSTGAILGEVYERMLLKWLS